MLELLKNETNYTRTENGALTYQSSLNNCLDLFSSIGAMRRLDEERIIDRFQRAYAENPDMAMKCLFFARDIRGGLGERNTFRVILKWLGHNHPETVIRNIDQIAEFGRWDDILVLLDTPCADAAIAVIKKQLAKDQAAINAGKTEEVSLLAKWLPSINASSKATVKTAKALCHKLELDYRAYRKLLTELRDAINIIENNLREKDYSFDYEKQPSQAMLKYRKAFLRNDDARYTQYLYEVREGKTSLHTGALSPYDVIAPICDYTGDYARSLAPAERLALDTTWNGLEDFTNDENALVVLDGSGSMYGYTNPSPAAVAQSLAIYYAERNKGRFHNHFITFSETPRLVEIKGRDIVEKLTYTMSYDECANTNLANVFSLLLKTAVKNKLPQEELPSKLYIISDMEFDICAEDADITNFEYAKRQFAEAGYQLPQVVFWNVDARNEQVPVRNNDQGAVLVSGCSPHIFSLIKSGNINPMDFMLETLNNERYAQIVA